MLVIWSGCDEKVIRQVIGPIIQQNPVPHIISKVDLLNKVKEGDVVLACGTDCLPFLQELKLVPKNRTIGSLREKELKYNGASIFTTYNPAVVSKDYARLPEIQWDANLAIRVHKTGSTKPQIGQYRYVESLHELIEQVDAKYEQTGKPVELACDLETLGLDEYAPEAFIIACSFTVEEGKSDVLYFTEDERPKAPLPWMNQDELGYWEGLWVQLHWLLTTEKVSLRGANFKFDSRWIKHLWGIACTNQKFDTILVGSLLDENRSNSLKLHAKIFTPLGGYEDDMDKYNFSRLDLVPKGELLNYVGGDTDATYRVAIVLKKQLLEDKRLTNFYVKLVQPAAKVFEKMEANGVLIDVPYYKKLQSELEVEIDRLQHEMLKLLPGKLRAKHYESIKQAFADDKSPFKPSLLREFLFTPAGLNLKPQIVTNKTKEASTSMDHLMMFEGDPVAANFISLFRELGSAQKTLSTYVVGFLKHLRSDGRFHPSYMLFRGAYGGSDDDSGTITGRTSAKDPAIQTLTKHNKWAKKLRRTIIAPPGYVILQLDFSQGELRITAVVADEPTMIKAYNDGADLHAITAAQLNGYEFEEFLELPEDTRDALRSGGKAGNFGLIYGMQAPGFRDYAYTTYGVQMTEDEAFQKREAFFDLYVRLPEWHAEYIAFAHKWGFVRSPLGRVRHLPLINSKDWGVVSQAERQAINSPIQSCLSDMMQLAMVLIDREYGQEVIKMFMMTHDSLALYVPEQDVVQWAKRIKHVMENLPLKKEFGWDSPLVFPADAEASVAGEDGVHSMAGLKKLKGL